MPTRGTEIITLINPCLRPGKAKTSRKWVPVMTPNLPPKLVSTVRSMIGAPVQTGQARSVREGPELGAPFENEKHDPARDRALPVSDIVSALRRYRYDPELRGERRVPLAVVAALAGLSRETIYQALLGKMNETTRVVLSRIISWIETGQVRLRRCGQRWEPEFRQPPEPLPPPQDKLTRAEDWRDWGACRTCGGRKWSAVALHGAAWRACANCVPRDQWPAMGGREPGPPRSQRRSRAKPRPDSSAQH
jgi:hypothetical protein